MPLTPRLGPQLPTSRRGLLLSAAPLLALPHLPVPRAQAAQAAARPIFDQPMRRLRLPKGTFGRDYVLVQLRVGGRGPFDFMIDTGLTAELITPHLRQVLDIPADPRRLETGLGAGGGVGGMQLVTLAGVRLVGADDLELPPLTAVVTDFVQEHLDPEHDPVEGMLGMELLQNFDVDFDFPAGRLRLFRPGDGVAAAAAAGLVDVPAAVLNETGVLGIRATSPAAAGSQPFVGMLDCGASFSALNWQAAALAGLPPRGDPAYGNVRSNGVAIIGMDGKPQMLPLTPMQFTFAGAASKAGEGQYSFAAPPPSWRPWQPVTAAVGDLPVFAQLLGDGRKPYDGPAALLGLDVLSQRRVVIGAGAGQRGRTRPLYVGAA